MTETEALEEIKKRKRLLQSMSRTQPEPLWNLWPMEYGVEKSSIPEGVFKNFLTNLHK